MKSRRDFLKKTSIIGAGLTLAPNLAFAKATSKKEKLNVALIGVGLRGTNHLNNLLQREDILITALCDIDPKRIGICLDFIKKASHPIPKTYGKNTLDYKMGSMIIVGGVVGTIIGISTFTFFKEIGKLSLIISLSYMYLLAIIGTLMLIELLWLVVKKLCNGVMIINQPWTQLIFLFLLILCIL